MTIPPGPLEEPPSSWLAPLAVCCAPLMFCLGREPSRAQSWFAAPSWKSEKVTAEHLSVSPKRDPHVSFVNYHEPLLHPLSVGDFRSLEPSFKDRQTGKKLVSTAGNRSAKSQIWPQPSPRRPLISAPSDFRHLNSGPFQAPRDEDSRPKAGQDNLPHGNSFRPLELSIYQPGNRISPILPHLDAASLISTPPQAHMTSFHRGWSYEAMSRRKQGYPSSNFRIPRRLVVAKTRSSVQSLTKREPARVTGRTSVYKRPDVDAIKERVASALIEVERLQEQIDEVIGLQGLYTRSRPTSRSSSGRRTTGEYLVAEIAVRPDILSRCRVGSQLPPPVPALPPAASSFSRRLKTELQIQTSEPNCSASTTDSGRSPVEKSGSVANASAASRPGSGKLSSSSAQKMTIASPPPLRKKKSFSRVSSWLFPGPEENSGESMDEGGKLSRSMKRKQELYHCTAASSGSPGRQSCDSSASVSTWTTDDGEDTAPTAWSPDSTPVSKQPMSGINREAADEESVLPLGKAGIGVAI